jgi:hypothetical protein
MQGIFEHGVPARITVADFKRYFLQNFLKFSDGSNDALIADAIDDVYAIFYGVATMWERHPTQVWYEKTVVCYRNLVAWYIADLYPTFVSGVPVMGGIPLKAKKIGGVQIFYAELDARGLLGSLKSNPFGAKAYFMITTSGRRFELGGKRAC